MDGKQHLSLEGLSGASGMKTLADAIGTESVGAAGDAAKTPGKVMLVHQNMGCSFLRDK